MKRSTVIYQHINNKNAAEIILHLHRLWCKQPKTCAYLLRRLSSEMIRPIRRRVSQQFWWVYRSFDFEMFLNKIEYEQDDSY